MPDWDERLENANNLPTDSEADDARRRVAIGAAKDGEPAAAVNAVRAMYYPTERDKTINAVVPVLLNQGYREEAGELVELIASSTILRRDLRKKLANYDRNN